MNYKEQLILFVKKTYGVFSCSVITRMLLRKLGNHQATDYFKNEMKRNKGRIDETLPGCFAIAVCTDQFIENTGS